MLECDSVSVVRLKWNISIGAIVSEKRNTKYIKLSFKAGGGGMEHKAYMHSNIEIYLATCT